MFCNNAELKKICMSFKIFMTFICLWVSIPSHSASFHLRDSYYSFVTEGKWGIMFNDDIVIYPRFDELKSILNVRKLNWGYNHYLENTYGLFAYKKNDKWGLLNEYGYLTSPIYDDMFIVGDYSIDNFLLVFYKEKENWGIMSANGQVMSTSFADEIVTIFKVWNRYKKQNIANFYVLAKKNGKGIISNLYGDIIISNLVIDKKPFYLIDKYKKKVRSIESKRHKNNGFSSSEINQSDLLKNEMKVMGSIDYVEEHFFQNYRFKKNQPIQVIHNIGKFGLKVDDEIIVPLILDSIGEFNQYGIAHYKMDKWTGIITKFGLVVPDKDLRYGKFANRGFYDTCGRLDAIYMEGRIQEASSGWYKLKEMMKTWNFKMPEAEDLLSQRLMAVNYDFAIKEKEEKRSKIWTTISSILSTANNFASTLNTSISNYNQTNYSSFEHHTSIEQRQNKNEHSNVLWMKGNYQTQKMVYSNYESQLYKMKNYYPNDYSDSQRIDIQRKMKKVRETILNHGGTCNSSPMETWKP